jgi:predicted DNA-binding transcriptional regulator AlpA
MTPLLTTEQTAALLNIPVKTLRDYRLRGIGPVAHKIGQHVRYAPSDVEAWLASRRDA